MNTSLPSLNDILDMHKAGNLSAAKEAYLQFLAAAPNHAEAMHLLALLLAEQGELDTAQQYLEKAIEINPDDMQYQLHLGNVLKAKNLFPQAEKVLAALTKKQPTFAAAFNNLGTVYFLQKKWLEAIGAFQAALDVQANYIDAYYNLGLAFLQLHQLEEAQTSFKSLLELALSLIHI